MISNKETMEAKKHNGLQRLTESKVEAMNDREARINKLLSKSKIMPDDVETLPVDDRAKFNEVLNQKLNGGDGIEVAELIEKIELILDEDSRRQLWERNHYTITMTINKLIKQFNRMPSKTEIAESSGISRQTIYKHLNDYSTHPFYSFELEQHRILGTKVLTKMYQQAMDGDVKAGKVYLQATGWLNKSSSKVNIGNQNNYIQMNGVIINEDALKQLPFDQFTLLSNMVKGIESQL